MAPAKGGFPGSARILAELDNGVSRRRVGLKPEGKAPVRPPAKLFSDAEGKTEIGHVSSGGFRSERRRPDRHGLRTTTMAEPGNQIFAEVRGKFLALTVTALPFVTPPTNAKKSPERTHAEIHR